MSESDLAVVALPEPVAESRWTAWRAAAAGIIGNTLEWYDFAVYGYFAPAIGRQFFPSEDPASRLLASFGAFAAGFLMRPIGGFVFGRIGDRIGRSPALTLSVLTMAVPTFLIGILPGKATLGILAPILLVLLRMIQGLAVGGEYTTSAVYLAERARPRHRGFAASWTLFGAAAGTLLGSAAGVLTTRLMPAAEVTAWGWRLPFLCGLVVGVLGLALRRHMPEPEAPAEKPRGSMAAGCAEAPDGLAQRSKTGFSWRFHFQLLCLTAFLSVGFYVCFVFSVTYFTDFVHVTARNAFDINSASMVVLLLTIPAAGALSDRLGRKKILLISAGTACVFAWPLFWLMDHPDPVAMFCGQAVLSVLVGMFSGVLPVTMAELLPRHSRCTSLSIVYNLGMALLGGTAPLVAAYLIERTQSDLAPAYYLAATAAISFLAVLPLAETARTTLRVE